MDIGEANTGFYSGFVLLLSSYLLGHIISQGSAYLDEWVYDKLKEKVYTDHKCVKRVLEIREQKYGNAIEPEYVNAYKWCLFKLQQEQPHAASEIERYMADSKFFRSLFVLLIILAGVFMLPSIQHILMTFTCLLLAAFSILRYFKNDENLRKRLTNTSSFQKS